jgi:large-conductance mechanosensitive channel
MFELMGFSPYVFACGIAFLIEALLVIILLYRTPERNIPKIFLYWLIAGVFTILFVLAGMAFLHDTFHFNKYKFTIVDFVSIALGVFAFIITIREAKEKDDEKDKEKERKKKNDEERKMYG